MNSPSPERRGYLVWVIAGSMFAVPEIWASADSSLPFPTLSGTVGHLERRWEIVSLFVILVIANAVMHAVRLGAALIAQRHEGTNAAEIGPARATTRLRAGTHVAVQQGRVTPTAEPTIHELVWLCYFPVTVIAVAAGFLIPLWVHGWRASDAEKQLAGEFGYAAMALTFFLIPGWLARLAGTLVPFPGLFQTVLNLERKLPVVAVLVAGCMTFLMLHLVFYPYPSIIPWFKNLEHLHNYCLQHGAQLICQPNKK